VLSKFYAEHKLKNHTGDSLLAMIKTADFVREDIRFEIILELEQIVDKSSGK
jgi:hypothetical protein